jgi:hypothetical protein
LLGVEQWAEIRRMRFVEGLSQREIHRRTGVHRDTIRRALASAEPPRYRGYGGHTRRSPVRLASRGRRIGTLWLISAATRAASTPASGYCPPPCLRCATSNRAWPRSRTTSPNSTPSRHRRSTTYSYRTRSEDKVDIFRPLAHALVELDIKVSYDEFELGVGDSLRRKIDAGIANSRFGVVVLSPAFFGKGWAEYELDGLVTQQVSSSQVLLPIWHDVTARTS